MAITTTEPALLRMLQLASPALPVGAYAFSQGLEYAIEDGWVKDAESTAQWLTLQLHHALTAVDVPLLLHLCDAWRDGDAEAVSYWNDYVLACRETAEIRLAEIATGEALARLLPAFAISVPDHLNPPTFLALFARAASHWQLDRTLAAYALVWSWLENQVMAATKILPLGQTQAQTMLSELQQHVPALIARAVAEHRADSSDEPGAGLPGVAIASSLHETQYSRLFRS